MKNFKRTVAAVMTSALLLTPCVASMSMNAFAANVSITNAVAEHTYNAYPIFTGTYSETKGLEDIKWANWVSETIQGEILADLNAKLSIATTSTPSQIADWLQGITDNKDETLDTFASVIAKHLPSGTNPAAALTSTAPSASVADGYYLLIDKGNSGGSYARYILEAVGGSVNISTKVTQPTLEKKIDEGGTLVDANTASVGDVVSYNIKTQVPNMTGYDKYFFVISDTLDKGLTYDSESIEINVATSPATKLTKDTDYYVETTGGSGADTNIKIVFVDFKVKESANAGKDIIVTYDATLNGNASMTEANKNTAKLTYSNNPNVNWEGNYDDGDTPDDPSDDTKKTTPEDPNVPDTPPKSNTPDSDVSTWTTQLKIQKQDRNNEGVGLAGANFKLYKLKAGKTAEATYDANTHDLVAAQITGADAIWTLVSEQGPTTNDFETALNWDRIGEGTYVIVESAVPTGYNPADPIIFTVSAGETKTAANWKKATGASPSTAVIRLASSNGIYSTVIRNNKGSQLPSTGGIGTTLFYVIGGMLVVGSSVVLVTKKRMSAEKK